MVELGGVLSNLGGALNLGVLVNGRSGTAEGELSVTGLTGFGDMRLGSAFGESGSASALLTVGDGGIGGGALQIGTSTGRADAGGRVEVASGDVELTGGLSLGTVAGGTGASGDGELRLEGVTGQVQSLQVGESFVADGNPHGRVRLSSSIIQVEEFVALGSGLNGGAGDGGLSLVVSRLTVGSGPDPTFLIEQLIAEVAQVEQQQPSAHPGAHAQAAASSPRKRARRDAAARGRVARLRRRVVARAETPASARRRRLRNSFSDPSIDAAAPR